MQLIESPIRLADDLRYPEGPCPLPTGDVLFVEYGRHALQRYRDGRVSTVWTEPGSGPASVAIAPNGDLWVCAFDANAVLHLDPVGRLLARHDRDATGALLRGPNDLVAAPDGAIYATVSGPFDPTLPPSGGLIRIRPGGRVERLATAIQFANGIALRDDVLYVAEHFRDRILSFAIRPDGGLADPDLFADLSPLPGPHPPLRGPDGIAFGPRGELYAAHFGCGRLAVVGPDGALSTLPLPFGHPTNVALDTDGRLLVTAFQEDVPPQRGALLRLDR